MVRPKDNPKDIVFIKNLKLDVIIGIYDHERITTQPISLTLEMEWDNRQAGLTDELTYALDYEKITNYITTFAKQSEFFLVERFTEVLAEKLLQNFSITALTLEMSKLTAIANTEAVGVRIYRERQSPTPPTSHSHNSP